MTARDDLEKIVSRLPLTVEDAAKTTDNILAEHAHELAKKIRSMPCYCGCLGSSDAADLIDPEVE